MTATLTDLARIAADSFETATRNGSDDRYVRVRDGSPEWVTDLVRDAHGDMLPDDWRYACIAAACEHIADDGDGAHDFADAYVDAYTGARLAWLSSHLSRVAYCDDAADDYGADGIGLAERIGLGQYAEASEVYGLVARFLEDRADGEADA